VATVVAARGMWKCWQLYFHIPLVRKEKMDYMIILNKLRGGTFALNCDLIETISENPDTTILLTNGNIYIVHESMQEVIDKAMEYHHKVCSGIGLRQKEG